MMILLLVCYDIPSVSDISMFYILMESIGVNSIHDLLDLFESQMDTNTIYDFIL